MKRISSAIVCLVGLYFVSGSISAQPKDPHKAKLDLPSQVTGLGLTLEKAYEEALHKAVKLVNSKGIAADEEFVRRQMLADEGEPGDDLKLENIDEPLKTWIVTFRYNGWSEAARHDRAEARASIARKVAFALSILLLAGVGYVRLDEYTRHRYTPWLRAAGSGIVALLLAASWFLVQG